MRDGLIISLKVAMGSEISIPLAVNALQRQLKAYITSATGVDVKEVRVTVQDTDDDIDPAGFRINEMPEHTPEEPKTQIPSLEGRTVSEQEKKERCLHQKLFHREEAAVLPEPPAPMPQPAPEVPEGPAPVEAEPEAPVPVAIEADEASPAEPDMSVEPPVTEETAEEQPVPETAEESDEAETVSAEEGAEDTERAADAGTEA